MNGNESNQHSDLFIDRLYLHFTIKNIPERINGWSGHTPGPGSQGKRTTDGLRGVGWEEGMTSALQERERICGALLKKGGEHSCSLATL